MHSHFWSIDDSTVTHTTLQLEAYTSFCLIKRIYSSSQRLSISKFWDLMLMKWHVFEVYFQITWGRSVFGDGKNFVSWPLGPILTLTLALLLSLSAAKLLWCQMAKVSSKRSPMPVSFLFANNKRVQSTEGHRLALWWYSTCINVIMTVPKSC